MTEEFKIGKYIAKELVEKFGTPLFVYNEELIRNRYQELKQSLNILSNKKILYACKANSNVEIIKILREEGMMSNGKGRRDETDGSSQDGGGAFY